MKKSTRVDSVSVEQHVHASFPVAEGVTVSCERGVVRDGEPVVFPNRTHESGREPNDEDRVD